MSRSNKIYSAIKWFLLIPIFSAFIGAATGFSGSMLLKLLLGMNNSGVIFFTVGFFISFWILGGVLSLKYFQLEKREKIMKAADGDPHARS